MKTQNIFLIFVLISLVLSPVTIAEQADEIDIVSENTLSLGNFAKIKPVSNTEIYQKPTKTKLLSTFMENDTNYSAVVTTGIMVSGNESGYEATVIIDKPSAMEVENDTVVVIPSLEYVEIQLTPTAIIVAPPNGTVTNQSQINVTTNIMNSETASLLVNGVGAFEIDEGINNYTINLVEGVNIVQAVAVNQYGENRSENVTIIYDLTPPIVNIIHPTGAYVRFIDQDLDGTVLETISDIQTLTYIVINEAGTANTTGTMILTNGEFADQITLFENQNNTIIVTAVDLANNTGSDMVYVSHNYDYPVVEITDPIGNITVNTPTITISTDVLYATTAQLEVDGIFRNYVSHDGAGVYDVSLHPGNNVLQLSALSDTGVTGYSNIVNVFYTAEDIIGTFDADPRIVRNGDSVLFTFYAGEQVNSVIVNALELGDDSFELTYAGNGYYTGTLVVNSTYPDGEKNITATAYGTTASSSWLTIILDNTQPQASIKINNDNETTDDIVVDLDLIYNDANGVKECRLSNLPFESVESGESFQFDEYFEDAEDINLDQTELVINNNAVLPEKIYTLGASIGASDITSEVSSHDYSNATLYNDTAEFQFTIGADETSARFCMRSSSENSTSNLNFYISDGSNYSVIASKEFSEEGELFCFSLDDTDLNVTSPLIVRANHSENESYEYIDHVYLTNLTNGSKYETTGSIESPAVVSTILNIGTAALTANYTIPTVQNTLDKVNGNLNETNVTTTQNFTLDIPANATVETAEFDVSGYNISNASLNISNITIWADDLGNSTDTVSNFQSVLNNYIADNCTTTICSIPIVLTADAGTLEVSNASVVYEQDNGRITWYMSNGGSFEQVVPSEPHTFSSSGTALSWRAVVETFDESVTPAINSVILSSDATPWGPCETQKVWILEDNAQMNYSATVFYQVKDNAGWVTTVNDSIIVNKSAFVLDWTPPTNLTVWTPPFTNDHDMLEASWYALDRESKVFYKYRILQGSTQIYPETENEPEYIDAANFGQQESVRINISEVLDDDEYLFEEGGGEEYYFEVIAVNGYYIESEPVMSDPTITDYEGPDGYLGANDLNLTSETHPDEGEWYNLTNIIMNWESLCTWDEDLGYCDDGYDYDDYSGIKGYSYILTTDDYDEPDEVPEGDPENLSEHLRAEYTNVNDGDYIFKIRAVDNAGNPGDIETYNVRIDTTPPGPPQFKGLTRKATNNTLDLEWVAANDGDGSGIAYYEIYLYNDSEYEFLAMPPINTTNNDTNKSISPPEGTYYIRIYAYDNVGLRSLPSDVLEGIIDLTPPEITWIKPEGVIIDKEPVIAVETDEPATCSIILENGTGVNMTFTGSVYHEKRGIIFEEGLNITINVTCEDLARNSANDSRIFIVDSNDTANSTDLNETGNESYIGDVVKIKIKVKNNQGKGLGEIKRNRFTVRINNTPVDDFGVADEGNGKYLVTFDSPPVEGYYNITVEVDGKPGTKVIHIKELTLTVSYNATDLEAEDKILYKETANYTAGIASDASLVEIDLLPNKTLESGTSDGSAYIFMTRTGANLGQRDRYLERKEFRDFTNPSFGYNIEELFTVSTEIEYEDIILRGPGRQIPSGRYNLVFRNAGIDPDTGKTIVEIDIR